MQTISELESVSNIRCLGMIAAAQLADAECAHRVRQALLTRGIHLRPLGSVVYLMLPLITPGHVIVRTVEELTKAIQDNS